ncbi:MAG: hypothetical protein ABIC95_05860 [archaeon]
MAINWKGALQKLNPTYYIGQAIEKPLVAVGGLGAAGAYMQNPAAMTAGAYELSGKLYGAASGLVKKLWSGSPLPVTDSLDTLLTPLQPGYAVIDKVSGAIGVVGEYLGKASAWLGQNILNVPYVGDILTYAGKGLSALGTGLQYAFPASITAAAGILSYIGLAYLGIKTLQKFAHVLPFTGGKTINMFKRKKKKGPVPAAAPA